ncbi:AGZA family xanthine/uracil permease-like MFS transporter [Catenibacillus scindens]|uniref:AGZA family xanthine/uracil permease-like MFS transporter n=1 Tax=Catenibacillus scindens TaxID=673271 RepID=A0A7W8HAT5_9FIRM|nr:NCS2 family permease [Catenibacillus scindens]MBB5264934.1 AGZA family xanthine/uracil permease-like MFS transporter [Catenibacillus scindens]
MEKFFKLKANGTTVGTEIIAGLTTFFAMAYIIVVNPSILSQSGMEWGAVFLATIIASIIGTLIMGLVANVPYAQAPGMGLNAFFVYTVCAGLGFTWQQALSMVFICGLLNIILTVSKLRKYIIKSIPVSMQNAIGGGIGIFVAYIGLLNVGIISFDSGVPALATLNQPKFWVFLIGLALSVILLVKNVKGAILIAIILTTIIGIPFQVTVPSDTVSFTEACQALPTTFLAIFREGGIISLFNDLSKLPLVLITIFSFSISDTFDTIGTFIGTGRRSGIFSEEDEKLMESGSGFKSRLDKALFADATATSIGSLFGTSNTTTFVESASGIGVGGRTGLTSVVVAICFAISAFLATFVSAVPFAATAPALVLVGVMMTSSFQEIKWNDLEEAIPAFFAGIFMAICYSISYGIAAGFIFYCIVKICKGKAKEIHPILWVCTGLFVLNFILLALL